jgi:hypothetical protein
VKVCISIDLDNYQDYQSLVDTKLDAEAPTFYRDAIPRFLDVFDQHDVKATFFAIGRDLVAPDARNALREIVSRGHEVGNHSFSHPYNFRQLSRTQKEVEIDQADAAIADAIGERPVGFRTPSCDISVETLDLLVERDYLYDSSIFPTPIMWLFMLYGLVFVRRAEYQLGPMSAVFAPPRPYYPRGDRLYRVRRPASKDPGPKIVEVPISVASPIRLPFYSTLARLLGERCFDWTLRWPRREDELHMLFHMIELADFEGTPLADSIGNTPGIGIPLERRSRFISHAVESLAGHGVCVPMRDLAREHQKKCGKGDAGLQ